METGSSIGLIISLRFAEGDLTAGKKIAGTGTIDIKRVHADRWCRSEGLRGLRRSCYSFSARG
jgi:hypothetical protein